MAQHPITPIKIVHIIGSLRTGGAENQVVQILNGLNSRLFKKYLVVFKDAKNANKKALHKNIQYHHIPLHKRGQVTCIARLIKFLKNIRPHIVQAHMFHSNLYSAVAARLAGVPIFITTEHGKNLWKKGMHHWLERNVITPLSTFRVAVSNDIKQIRINSGDISHNKIDVITPCVSIPRNPLQLRDSSNPVIGSVGRLVEAKDYHVLLKSFSILSQSYCNLKLILVGDGPMKQSLISEAAKMNCQDRIIFAGKQNNVYEWLAKFDLFVMSSIREGIPVAMLEAMSYGLPVVATTVGGIPEVVTPGVEGLLVDPRSPDQLAEAINKLLSDYPLRKKMGENARLKVENKFSQPVICKQYEQLYTKLLSQRKKYVQ